MIVQKQYFNHHCLFYPDEEKRRLCNWITFCIALLYFIDMIKSLLFMSCLMKIRKPVAAAHEKAAEDIAERDRQQVL